MKKLLFLDFDGVLVFSFNAQGQMHPSITLLEDFLRKNSDVEVVFSTSWRLHKDFDDLVNLFDSDVRSSFVGITPFMGVDSQGSREKEILYYVRNTPNVVWAALDDRLDLFTPKCKNLIHVRHSGTNCITIEDMKSLERHYKQKNERIYGQRNY